MASLVRRIVTTWVSGWVWRTAGRWSTSSGCGCAGSGVGARWCWRWWRRGSCWSATPARGPARPGSPGWPLSWWLSSGRGQASRSRACGPGVGSRSGFFVIPAIAVIAAVVSISPVPSAVRWSHNEGAFARVDQTLPAARSPRVVYRPMARAVGSFHVFSVFTVNGGRFYVLTDPTDLDSEGCQSGVAHLPAGPHPAVGGLYLRRHLGGPWYGFQSCWD